MIKTILPIIDPRTKQVTGYKLNAIKIFVRSFWLSPAPPDDNGIALGAVAGASRFSPLVVTQEGPFQGYSLVMKSDRFDAVGDHECLVQLTDSGSRKQLSNRPVHANTIFGTAGLPFVIPERWFMHENSAITVTLQNLFANANILRPFVVGRRIYQTSASAGVVDDLVADMVERATITSNYVMTTTDDIVNLAAGVATPYRFPVDADAFFEIFKICAVIYENHPVGPPTRTGQIRIELLDSESGRRLSPGMTQNIPDAVAFGNGQLPFILPESWVISPKTIVNMNVVNTTPSGNPVTCFLSFIGRKIYV